VKGPPAVSGLPDPPVPPDGAATRPTPAATTLPPTGTDTREGESGRGTLPRTVVIQRNPHSGTGWRRGLLHDLIRELRAQGFRPRLFKSRPRLDAWLADPVQRATVFCLVAAGGDGTISDLVNRHPGLPLALLPVGTENVLAQGLGIPVSGVAVARLIAAGHRRRIDLGELNGRRFLLMVSAGFDAEVVHRVHRDRRGHLSHLSYLPAVVQTLRHYRYPQMRVWRQAVNPPAATPRTPGDNSNRPVPSPPAGASASPGSPVPLGSAASHGSHATSGPALARLVVVVNFPRYALGLRVAGGARADDGLLDVRLFERGSMFQMLRYFYSLWWSKHERLPDVNSLTTDELRLESDDPIPLQADGDPAGHTPAVLRILPNALELLVPHNSRSG